MQKRRSTGSISYSYFFVSVDERGNLEQAEVDKIKSFGWTDVPKQDSDVKQDIAKAKKGAKKVMTTDPEVVSVEGLQTNQDIQDEISKTKAKKSIVIPNIDALSEMKLKDMKLLAEEMGVKTDIIEEWKTKKVAIEYITNFKI